MVGQKYLEKKIGHHACLKVNNFSFLAQQIVRSKDAQRNTGE